MDEEINANDAALNPDEAAGNEEIIDDSNVQATAEGNENENEAPAEEPKTRGERRENSYISRLSEQIRNSGLESRPNESKPYEPLKYDEGEYDIPQLEADRKALADAEYRRGLNEAAERMQPLEQKQWGMQFDSDADKAARVMPELDEDSDEYDENVDANITQLFMEFVGFRKDPTTGAIKVDRPNVRFLDFVKAQKQTMDDYAERVASRRSANISGQAARTGVKPGAQPRANTSRANMSYQDLMKLPKAEYDAWGRAEADRRIAEGL